MELGWKACLQVPYKHQAERPLPSALPATYRRSAFEGFPGWRFFRRHRVILYSNCYGII